MNTAKFWLMGAAMYVAQYVILTDGGPSRLYWFSGFALLSCAAVGVAVRKLESRLPWGLLAAGIGTFVAADLVYDILERRSDGFPPFPSIADVFYLGAYALLAVGVIAFGMRSGDAMRTRRAAIIGAGAAIATMSFFWTSFAADTLSWHGDLLPRLVGLAYPAMTALLVGAIGFMIAATSQFRVSHAFMGLAATVFAIGDYAYNVALQSGTFTQGGFTDACWLVAYALFAAAAIAEMTSGQPQQQFEEDTGPEPSLHPSFLPV